MESTLKQKLTTDLKEAMKSKQRERCGVIRMVMSAIHNAEIAKRGELDDTGVLGVISKEVKQHKESIEAFKMGNRQDLVDKEEAEMAILQEYLPEQITTEEIMEVARRIIEEVGAKGPADKGKVMPRLIAELKGKADGREINTIVTALLSS